MRIRITTALDVPWGSSTAVPVAYVEAGAWRVRAEGFVWNRIASIETSSTRRNLVHEADKLVPRFRQVMRQCGDHITEVSP